TGFACVWYFRRDLTKSARNFWLVGVAPLVGGIMLAGIFVKSCYDLSKDDAGSTTYFGLGSPFVIGIGFLLLGPVLMLIWYAMGHHEFWKRRREVADPRVLDDDHVAPEPAPVQPGGGSAPRPRRGSASAGGAGVDRGRDDEVL